MALTLGATGYFMYLDLAFTRAPALWSPLPQMPQADRIFFTLVFITRCSQCCRHMRHPLQRCVWLLLGPDPLAFPA
jgi:hypothetical protein